MGGAVGYGAVKQAARKGTTPGTEAARKVTQPPGRFEAPGGRVSTATAPSIFPQRRNCAATGCSDLGNNRTGQAGILREQMGEGKNWEMGRGSPVERTPVVSMLRQLRSS